MEFTRILQDAADGRKGAFERAVAIACADLERTATSETREPAALVNETFLRLARQHAPSTHRRQFFAIATKVLTGALIVLQRARSAGNRGGMRVHVTLGGLPHAPYGAIEPEVDALVEALERLAALDERRARVVELRCFWNMDVPEIAATLEVSAADVERDWEWARTWLAAEFESTR